MVAMLDETYPKLKEDSDENEYKRSGIRVCNGPAARDMRRSFPIKLGLMAGVRGQQKE